MLASLQIYQTESIEFVMTTSKQVLVKCSNTRYTRQDAAVVITAVCTTVAAVKSLPSNLQCTRVNESARV